MRECTLCHKKKPLDEFYKNSCYKDGYSTRCKGCLRAMSHIRSVRLRKPRYCVVCGKPLRSKQKKYCSLSCYMNVNNRRW